MNACGGSKEIASTNLSNSEVEQINKTTEKNNQADMTITYSAMTRGSYTKITATENSMTYQLSLNAKPTTVPIEKKDWDDLMNLLEPLSLKELTTLEAPSKAHQYDGAVGASLSFTLKGEEPYNVPTYDAGNPHEKIAPFVKKFMSLIPSK